MSDEPTITIELPLSDWQIIAAGKTPSLTVRAWITYQVARQLLDD
jgi:hypothetical protein